MCVVLLEDSSQLQVSSFAEPLQAVHLMEASIVPPPPPPPAPFMSQAIHLMEASIGISLSHPNIIQTYAYSFRSSKHELCGPLDCIRQGQKSQSSAGQSSAGQSLSKLGLVIGPG